MTGEDSRWRSADAYRRIERLSPSDIAWEFLRRNPDYIRDYEAFARSGNAAPLGEELCQHWGLRFPGRSGAPSP